MPGVAQTKLLPNLSQQDKNNKGGCVLGYQK